MLKCRATISLPTVSTRLARISALAGFGRTDPHAYSSILRGIASRFQNFASSGEVASRKRVAIPTRNQLHTCCHVETRRDAILIEMRRDVSWSCDIGIDSLGL